MVRRRNRQQGMMMMPQRTGPVPVVSGNKTARRRRRRTRQREAIKSFRQQRVGMEDWNDPSFRRIGMQLAPSAGPMRSEAVPNENFEPSMPALIKRGGAAQQVLSSLGSTQAGQMWALKALHPNGEEVTASAGIPDHTNVPVVTPEFRSNVTITGDSTATGNDDVDIVVLPIAEMAFMWRRRTAGTNVPLSDGWHFEFYPALSVLTNAVTGLTPASGTGDEIDLSYWLTSLTDYGRSRGMYNGLTMHLDAPALADQGRVTMGQLPIEQREGNISALSVWDDTTQTRRGVEEAISVFTVPERLPMTEGELFQATPGAVVWEAREGGYIPMRFREPVHLFEADRAETFFAVNEAQPVTIIGTSGTGTDIRQLSVGVPTNFLSAIILVRGIDKRANINVKARLGLETLVEWPSEVAPFQHASPILDQMAIDRVTQLSQASPMAYPANYNDFSSILGVIKNVLTNIVKPISGAIGGLGIPVVSNIAGGVNSIISAIGLGPRRRGRRSAMMNMAARM